MPKQVNKVDSFQTRFYQSFVNLTKYSSTNYPAVTSLQITIPENCSTCEPLSTYNIYDQWALRVVTDAAPSTSFTA